MIGDWSTFLMSSQNILGMALEWAVGHFNIVNNSLIQVVDLLLIDCPIGACQRAAIMTEMMESILGQ
jgi:hypothetical protein